MKWSYQITDMSCFVTKEEKFGSYETYSQAKKALIEELTRRKDTLIIQIQNVRASRKADVI